MKERLKYLWYSFCYKECLKHESAPDNPVYQLVGLFLTEAIRRNAERIVLGMLPDDYTIQEQYDDEQDALSDEEIAVLCEENDCKPEDFEIDPQDLRIAFSDSVEVVGNIPFWYCRDAKGYQWRSLPLQMYQRVVEAYLQHETSGIYLPNHTDGPCRVFYRLGLQENYCYYIRITKIENEPNKGMKRTR